MVRQPEEYDEEDDSDNAYGHEEVDNMADGNLHKGAAEEGAPREGSYGSQSDQGEDDGDMQMQIHPDLIAAAHKMGVELDSEQFVELQKLIEANGVNLNENEESEPEGDDDQHHEAEDHSEQPHEEEKGHHSSSDSSKKHQKKSSSSSSHSSQKDSSNR